MSREMPLGFVVTSYNILPYIDRCLDSLAACVRPGDRVVLVDDGSSDGSAERIAERAAAGLGAGVTVTPVLFGTNTIGGVGIAGNTGMAEVLADPALAGLFFVDGDDWLEAPGFHACRAAFERSGADILIGNYAEYDEAKDSHRRPADAARWARVPALRRGGTGEAARDLALAMIAVPWRKFYRSDFLRRHGLRFPEGRFFFEDNPFHWAVCLKAESIAFHDALLCQHRINRPGQTMASTGAELAAFFDHYRTIRGLLPTGDETARAGTALDWLLNNMAWHVERLAPSAYWAYAGRAAQVLAEVPEPVWQAAAERFASTQIGAVAGALRRGDVPGVVAVWAASRTQSLLSGVQSHLRRLETALADQGQRTGELERQMRIGQEIARYAALRDLPMPDLPPALPASLLPEMAPEMAGEDGDAGPLQS